MEQAAAPVLAPARDAGWDGITIDAPPEPNPGEIDTLTLTIDGWEGPLHLLLDLARRQKVDLRRISILALVDQYLEFVQRAGKMRLELAADYLVMAAWLAWLKSLLLLPRDPEVQPSPEELALRLQLRLQRLSAMREAGARLLARDRLGRDVFARGAPEGLRTDRRMLWDCDLFALIQAWGVIKQRTAPVVHMVHTRPVMTLESELIAVRALAPGDSVGYGSSFVAEQAMRVGVVACGYADGYPRLCPTGTPVLVEGVRSSTVGRVSMDMLVVDLTEMPQSGFGSEVTLWGRAGNGAVLSIDEVAHSAGTVGYELMCALAPRVPVLVEA